MNSNSQETPSDVIASAIEHIFQTMYFSETRYLGPARAAGFTLGTVIGFSGEVNGEFRVAVTEALAGRMAADFMALEPEEVSPEQKEASVREFTNVACGAIVGSWMPKACFRFTLPEPLSLAEAGEFSHCFSVLSYPAGEGDAADLAIEIHIP